MEVNAAGFDEFERIIIESAVRFFLADYDITQPVFVERSVGPVTDFVSNEDDYHLIVVNKYSPLHEQISTVAHECVHVAQYEMGRCIDEVAGGREYMVFEGERYLIRYSETNWDKPWEVEARLLTEKNIKKFNDWLLERLK